VIYFGSGWRTTIAMTALETMGWEDVTAMKNTYQEWVYAGSAVSEGIPEEAAGLRRDCLWLNTKPPSRLFTIK